MAHQLDHPEEMRHEKQEKFIEDINTPKR